MVLDFSTILLSYCTDLCVITAEFIHLELTLFSSPKTVFTLELIRLSIIPLSLSRADIAEYVMMVPLPGWLFIMVTFTVFTLEMILVNII